MRYALIKNREVINVIKADPDYFERADPRWRAQFDSWEPVDDKPEAEPGAAFDERTKAVTRSMRVRPKTKEEELEERLAALETKKAE